MGIVMPKALWGPRGLKVNYTSPTLHMSHFGVPFVWFSLLPFFPHSAILIGWAPTPHVSMLEIKEMK